MRNEEWTLIPTKKIIFRTQLSREEVLRRVKTLLETQDENALHRFEGEVGTSGFDIREIPRPRSNSFLPAVKGEVLSDEKGTYIEVVMRLNGCAFAFLLFWCYPFALILVLGIVSAIRNGIGKIYMDAVISVVFLAAFPTVMITMTTLGFRQGVRSVREFLANTFE